MKSISHELVTYLNGAYALICDLNEKVKSRQNEFTQQIKIIYSYLTLQLYKMHDFQDFQELANG